jgi:biofilm PGA synthesis N-glycosyltransferase PgaC
MQTIYELLGNFVISYPLFMGCLWTMGGLYFWFHWERNDRYSPDKLPLVQGSPNVSLLVPCHNESDNIAETIRYLLDQQYSHFEVIAINDGSTDNTAEILNELERRHSQLRVLHLDSNQGKAMALRLGALLSNSEYLICIDGDALLAPTATAWLVKHLHEHPRVGAVTGNPRIRNRSTILGKLQVGEFSSMVGLIKRAQRVYGRLFTLSGVVCAFRKTALHQVGYWNTDMITEDIDISWRLQLASWDVRFEPRALCWILTPETIVGLWRQRIRWARGGAEVFIRHAGSAMKWRSRRMWLLLLEYLSSLVWSYCALIFMALWLMEKLLHLSVEVQLPSLVYNPGWIFMIFMCLLQFSIGVALDSRYEKKLFRNYFWIVWFPLAYWVINALTAVFGAPRALFAKRGVRATWVSPDRGVSASE